jgi:hypothetical protein
MAWSSLIEIVDSLDYGSALSIYHGWWHTYGETLTTLHTFLEHPYHLAHGFGVSQSF